MSALKRVPESLPFGIVTDPSPYITSFSLGAQYTLVDKQTDAEIKRAATRIGKSLQCALNLKFRTER